MFKLFAAAVKTAVFPFLPDLQAAVAGQNREKIPLLFHAKALPGLTDLLQTEMFDCSLYHNVYPPFFFLYSARVSSSLPAPLKAFSFCIPRELPPS